MLGDSDEGPPSSEEEGDELVSEEISQDEEGDEEGLRALSSSDDDDDDDDGGPADPHTLYKRMEDEEFDAGIVAMQRRLAAKKAELELPTQRRKRKGGEEEEAEAEEEDENEERGEAERENVAATLPLLDDEPAIASLERATIDAGSDNEAEVRVPLRPPPPRDETAKKRRLVVSSSLLDEPDAQEVLAAMRPAASFRQAPQALRERKGTSFIADRAERKEAGSGGSNNNSKATSSLSSSASASLTLSHSGYVFGRDSGGAKAKPAAPAAAAPAASAKLPTDSKKRTVCANISRSVYLCLSLLVVGLLLTLLAASPGSGRAHAAHQERQRAAQCSLSEPL